MSSGYLDANLFIHAIANDDHTAECKRFLEELEKGTIAARIEPIVLHEITFALPRFAKQLGRRDVAAYLLSVLDWPGVISDKPILAEALDRWRRTPGLGFTDAYLASVAVRDGVPVYTKNVREPRGQGAEVPDPLIPAEPVFSESAHHLS
ncbi:MAG TPA: type II toxin-antitoxin system VapC family toxin [Thermomicrobiales bacterium]|jgi:predicted nucleic acid-binding protein